MVQVVCGLAARKDRKRVVLPDKREHWQTDYLGPEASLAPAGTLEEIPLLERTAQAVLVEKPPSSVVPPHFHCVNQFQVVVEGNGTLGRHAVGPGSVHYSAGYTGYGPISAGDQGLSYFTLRAQFDFGAFYLPQSKGKLKNVEREFAISDEVALSDSVALAQRQGATLETIIHPRANGLCSYLARLGPGATLQAPPAVVGGGQYWLVMAGELLYKGAELPRLSCLFISPDDPMPLLEAGSLGAEVVVVQYPRDPEPRPQDMQG